ncbi:DUF4197 domain-containing protein [bacterium]|nr:DUF4197 domain-containing protein [bacterium]
MTTFSGRWRHAVVVGLLCGTVGSTQAGWLDWLIKPSGTESGTAPAAVVKALTEDEIARGLKQALSNGVVHAVAQLGKEGGFLNNLDVKIPMPERLQQVEKALRALGQNKLADEFVATMNHAAEQAVPEAAQIFGSAVSQMTLADARAILQGSDDAATQYLRKTGGEQLTGKMLPIVKQATGKVGVTSAYKNLIQKAGPAAQLFGVQNADLDGYVTEKAVDGVFKMIAAEEKRIRANPVARTTDLLQRVFGAKAP